jgi:transposase-like protein
MLKVLTKNSTSHKKQKLNIQHPDLINILLEEGFENTIPKISELLINAAMLFERIGHIDAAPNESNVEGRNGHANGFKPRSFHTFMGGLNLTTPQVRGSDIPFRTSLLEKGSRSDNALKAVLFSMYLHGVSTCRGNGKRLVLGVSCALSEAAVH